jgi:hypothetical protein
MPGFDKQQEAHMSEKSLRIFIGHDPHEIVAYNVLAHSINRLASRPVSITPLMLEDVANLFDLCDDRYAIMCVKHHHVPEEDIKFLSAVQTKFEKKDWPSVLMAA